MRIANVYLKGIGPFERSGNIHGLAIDDDRVLLTGISGSGKSTVLWAIAFLWRLLSPEPTEEEWPEGSIAMHITRLPAGEALIVWSDDAAFQEEIKKRHPNVSIFITGKHHPHALRGVLSTDNNMILLDADFHFSDSKKDFFNAWFLTDDDVKDDWPKALSQLHMRNSLCSQEALKAVNRLLVDKKLVILPSGQVHVELRSNKSHTPQQMSMGERHMAVLCFCAACCLKQGGVLLLDEPAVHLHPSQVMGLLTTLEHFCRKTQGQMLLVSHNPAIWQRYEELGLTVDLEAGHGGE